MFSIHSKAQENDSINILFDSEWKISYHGLQPHQNKLKLIRYNRKEDYIKYKEFKDSIIRNKNINPKLIARLKNYKYNNYYGEFLVFDSVSNANYHLRTWYLSGVNFYNIKEF